MYLGVSHVALALLTLGAPALATPIVLPRAQADGEPTHSFGFGESRRLFSQVLSLTDPKSLHEALHSWHPKFTDGAFESDHSAAHAIHDESPALASAILELAKRQDTGAPNTTNTSTPESSPSESARVETVTPSLSVETVVQQTTFTPPPQTIGTQSQAFSEPTPVTTSTLQPPDSTQATTSVIVTTTQIATSAASTAVSVVSTLTTAPQSSETTPNTPTTQAPEVAASSTSVFVTTIPATNGGAPSVYTSVVVVGVTGKNNQGAATTSPAGAKSGSLIDAGSLAEPAPFLSSMVGALVLLISGWMF